MKRLFDIVASVLFLLITWPVILFIAVLVKFNLGSPVVFSQLRPGLNCKPFLMFKFRSMTCDKNISGDLLSDNERLTPFGQFLRKSSLDELPEFINVIKGDMSLVGPRPLLMDYLVLYSPTQIRRHEVRPGITGWAQINGRNAISWEEKFELDVWYVDNKNFWLDLKILWLTLGKVFMRQNINQEGHVTIEKFKGSCM